MRLRTFLPLFLVALGTGYVGGLLFTLRTMDRADPAGPGEGAAAREALLQLEEPGLDPAARAAGRAAFLARFPDSWLGARWERAR